MRLTAILLGFVIICLIIGGIMFAAANLTSSTVGDTYGSAASAGTNATTSMLETVTGAGVGAGLGLVLVLAVLGMIGGIFLIRKRTGNKTP